MNVVRYLIVDHRGTTRLIGTAPTRGRLKSTEYAFRINLILPDVRPIPAGEITITVPPWPQGALEVVMYEALAEAESAAQENDD